MTAETIVTITEVDQDRHPEIGDPVHRTTKKNTKSSDPVHRTTEETTKSPNTVTDLIATNQDESN